MGKNPLKDRNDRLSCVKCNKVKKISTFLVEHELLTLPEQLSSSPDFSWVRVARSLVFCVVFCKSLSFRLLVIVLSVLLLLAIVLSVLLLAIVLSVLLLAIVLSVLLLAIVLSVLLVLAIVLSVLLLAIVLSVLPLAIVLSVLRFTDFDNLIGIFKLLFQRSA